MSRKDGAWPRALTARVPSSRYIFQDGDLVRLALEEGVSLVEFPAMLVALDRPVPPRSPAEHARQRAERMADRRRFTPTERACWLARRTSQLARLARVADAQRAG
jgi:hypothetical protein